ncbi:hypothetical protein [Paraburkholderia susongensis]|uniref:DUF4148 domain-containing protein n=1 Tax=Paraburkholderia susongensis TaxID=1515439 RepID=A0A1X7KSR6_9BURK|nr:hypothetical protein [Paraburkholderia susongensis]SMG44312.1 hypothetical protein SAMN06265784_104251 [Paraburkholderia susongensis]
MSAPIQLAIQPAAVRARAWMFAAVAICATPAFAFAQNDAAPAAPNAAAAAANSYAGNRITYGKGLQTPAERTAKNRNAEQDLLGAPPEYGLGDNPEGNTDDAQRKALLDERRMTVLGQMPNAKAANAKLGKTQRNAPAAGDPMRAPNQTDRPNAANGAPPRGAPKEAYADPYGGAKRAVYRSPW